MGLSYRDAAEFLALLERYLDPQKVEELIKEAKAKQIGAKGSKQTWDRIAHFLNMRKQKAGA